MVHLRLLLLLGAEAPSAAAFRHARCSARTNISIVRMETKRIRNMHSHICSRTAPALRVHQEKDDQVSILSAIDPCGKADDGWDNGISSSDQNELSDGRLSNRRKFMGSALVTVGTLAGGGVTSTQAAEADDEVTSSYSLPWKTDPVNKRSGVTVSDAEKTGYNVAFVTYLSRFLLNFDTNCQRWWFSTPIPKNVSPKEIEQLRIEQFASFSASVEVSLGQNYATSNGPQQLVEDLVRRYGKVPGSSVEGDGDDPNKSQRRLARSARRQIALMFGLLERTQPVAEITKLLASVDNGGIASVKLLANETSLSGYELNSPPKVIIPPPEAGEAYVAAEGRAILKPTGKLLRIDIIDAGSGYSAPPVITIKSTKGGTPAKAEAKIATDGVAKGSIKSVQLIDTGSGYTDKNNIQIQVSPPELGKGRVAVLSPVLDEYVENIVITNGGTGYAVEKPLKVTIELPTNKSEFSQVGVAYATAEKTSFTAFRRESDKKKVFELEDQFETKYNMKPSLPMSGIDSELPPLPIWSGGKSSSAELLRLLPAGIGLEYDSKTKRYALAADTEFLSKYPAFVQQSSNRPLGSEYGPRGRAPIERDLKLGLASYLRFGLSGAICASGVHLALTPIDVVKTKGQVDPVKYPNIRSSLSTIWNEEGPSTLFTGWLPTYLGNFAGGGALYLATEYIRRTLSEAAGVEAISLEVPIILFAAAIAASLNACLICPFEAVRIRTVAQPEYGTNSVLVLKRMLNEEGFGSLVNAIPVFLARNIPYAMTKFLVFDLSSEKLYGLYPATQEDLKLSLLVSLVCGIFAGIAAAIVSNPADTVISELKKNKSDISPLEAANNMIERAGPPAFFNGLPLRMAFYSLNVSMTFVVYDFVKFLLGIGPQDLKLYLDVLGGALNDSPLT